MVDWRDEGVVIGVRRHGETSVILELMTRDHGRHLGVVRGGRSRHMRPVLQLGNGVEAVWRARIDEQIGTYVVEGLTLRAAGLMRAAAPLHGLNHVAGLLRLLPERDPHLDAFSRAILALDLMEAPALAAPLVVALELALLADLGFGLDLDSCAATGARENLAYVSPKTGRAVSEGAGRPYHDRLLALPAFLRGEGAATTADVVAGFALTGRFLERDVYGPRGMPVPTSRAAFVAAISGSPAG